MNEMQAVVERLERLEAKVDAVYRSAEKTRKYFLGTLIVTVVTVVLPLVAMLALVPYFVSSLGAGALNVTDLGL